MIKKYYKCSTELEDGRVMELLKCREIHMATGRHPEEIHDGSPIVKIDGLHHEYEDLLDDEVRVVCDLIGCGNWVEFFPTFEKQSCD